MRNTRRSVLGGTLLLLLLCAAPRVAAQKKIKTENLPNFDLRTFHFGFVLGYNTSDFFVTRKPFDRAADTLLVLDHLRQPGFNLGIISSLNMTPNLSLRFVPSLSFQDRQLQYTFLKDNGKTTLFTKQVESTYLEFPLLLKLRSDRINNFAVYLLAGGKYSIDMASQKDVNNMVDDEIVIKLQRNDYSAEVGGGMDMFLPYFKFGVELKMGIGIPNVFIDDNTRFSAPIEGLRTKTWVLSFTFEG